MKRNIKTNLKLAGICATAMMTLSGCGSKYTNVIEDISGNKVLVKDIKDGKQRIIEFGVGTSNWTWNQLKHSQIGDTITVVESSNTCGYEHDKYIKVCHTKDNPYNWDLKDHQYGVRFDENLWQRRKLQEHERQQQAKFDSLKYVIAHESQGKQR